MALPPRTVILGSPASPTHKVDPIELADLLEEMQNLAAAGQTLLFEDTLANLTAIASPQDGWVGFVLDDGVNSGVYLYSSGWSKTAELPPGFGALSAADIKALYEANADTNAFTDAEKSKLAGIDAGAEVNPDAAGIKALYEANADTNAFTDAEKTSLASFTSIVPFSNATRSRLITQETAFVPVSSERIVGKDTTPASSTSGGAGTYLMTGRPAVAGAISEVSIWANAQTAKLKVYRPSAVGGTAYTLAYEVSLVLSAGLNTFSTSNGTLGEYLVQDGDVIGIYVPSNIHYDTVAGSDGYTFFAGDKTDGATLDNLGAVGTIELQLSVKVSAASSSDLIKSRAVDDTLSRTFSIGESTLAAPSPLQYVDTAYTYAWDWEFKSAANLTGVAMSSQITGVGKIVVLEPYLGGYRTQRSIQVKFGSGVSTLVAGTDFPADVLVPKGGLIAFKVGTGSSIHNTVYDNLSRNRTWYGDAADGIFPSYDWPSGLENLSGVVRLASSAQIRFDFRETVDPVNIAAPQYIAQDKFDQTYGSVVLQGDAWTKGAGKMSSGATGIASGLEWVGGFTHLTDFKARWKFEFTSSGEVYFYKRPENGGSGSIVGLDMGAGNIILYNGLSSTGTIGSVNTSRTCTVTLTTGRDYIVTLDKDYRDWVFTVTDAETGESDSISWDGDASALAGFAYGTPGIAVASGAVDLLEFSAWSDRKAPQVVLLGDSITEGTGGTTIADTWAYQVCETANGVASPRGGDTALNIASRAQYEFNAYPSVRYAIFLMGTNDTDMTVWQRAVDNAAELCNTYGIVPVFGTLPPEAADTNPVLVQNPYIRASGYRFIDFARALTVGGDGTTRDASKFADALHPNDAGHAAMVERVRLDLPELFD